MTELGISEADYKRRHDDDAGENELRIRWSIVLQIVAYIMSLVAVYVTLSTRVAVIETRVDSLHSDISEMKADIKTLLQRKQ